MTKCTKDIERIFDCYCKRILKNCFIDYVRERKNYNNYNVSIESLSEREKLKLSYIPVFEIESKKPYRIRLSKHNGREDSKLIQEMINNKEYMLDLSKFLEYLKKDIEKKLNL